MRCMMAVGFIFLLSGSLLAQPERYELGQRLKQFEQAWEKQTDPAIRVKALNIVEKASTQFLSFQLSEAARTLDESRFVLENRTVSEAERWLTALYVIPEKRLIDGETTELAVTVKPFYKVKGGMPAGVSASIRLAAGPVVPLNLDKLPQAVKLESPKDLMLAEQDLGLIAEWNGRRVLHRTVPIFKVANLQRKLEELQRQAREGGRSIEQLTIRDRAALLAELAEGSAPETDLPLRQFFVELFGTGSRAGDGPKIVEWPLNENRPGGDPANLPRHERHLTLPVGTSKSANVRLFVPQGVEPAAKMPLVIALHGAGGTENLFFEGYGDGHIVKECEKRKWMLVAPRGGFGMAAPVNEIVDQLAVRYPIDRNRLFLVGHSMGAAQTIDLCQKHPNLFAGAAALGGGGRVRDAKAFVELPVFVGVGTRDFALSGARALKKALTDGGAKKLTYREYPEFEHLVICREALPDAFRMFDAAGKR